MLYVRNNQDNVIPFYLYNNNMCKSSVCLKMPHWKFFKRFTFFDRRFAKGSKSLQMDTPEVKTTLPILWNIRH